MIEVVCVKSDTPRSARKKDRARLQPYSALERKDMKVAYLMLAPAVICLTLFVVIPTFMAIEKSFYEWNFYTDSVYVGLENFRIIFVNEFFRQSIANVLRFVVVLVPLNILAAFSLALVLRRVPERMTKLVKSAIYIPGIIAGVIVSAVFALVFDYRAGMINQLIRSLGGERIAFLAKYPHAFWAIVVTSMWMGLGGGTILMYAALVNIPEEFYEAASIDGAGMMKKLFYITIPQMKNILVLCTISGVTGTLQMFDLPMFLTNGGPLNKTLTPMLYMYNNFRDRNKTMGYTVAGALLIMIVIAIINSFVFKLIRSEKSLEG